MSQDLRLELARAVHRLRDNVAPVTSVVLSDGQQIRIRRDTPPSHGYSISPVLADGSDGPAIIIEYETELFSTSRYPSEAPFVPRVVTTVFFQLGSWVQIGWRPRGDALELADLVRLDLVSAGWAPGPHYHRERSNTLPMAYSQSFHRLDNRCQLAVVGENSAYLVTLNRNVY